MSSEIATYVVRHEESAPPVGRGTSILGGEMIAVAWEDLFEKISKLEDVLVLIKDADDFEAVQKIIRITGV